MLATYDLPGAVYALVGQCIGVRLVTPRLHLASWHPRRYILPSVKHIGDPAGDNTIIRGERSVGEAVVLLWVLGFIKLIATLNSACL